MIYTISKTIFALFLKFFCRIKISGVTNIPKKGGFIVVSNHVSYLDPLAVGSSCSRKLNFMAKDSLFKVPILSSWLRKVGAFPVKRNRPDLFALKHAIARVKQGEGLLVFPEGTRRVNNKLTDPQAGIGFLVSKTKAPIIPSFVEGTDLAMPKGAKFIRPSKVSVCFGPEICVERRKPRDYQGIAEQVMDGIRSLGS